MIALPSTKSFTHQKGVLAGSLLYRDMPAESYHADISVQSCSLLKQMLTSPAHYQAQFFAPRKSSPSMDFGTLVHCLVLEPGKFSREFAVYQGPPDKRSTEYKAFAELNVGRTIISESELIHARTLQQKILERRVRGRPFGDYVREGTPEATIYYTDPSTGVRCRCRIDLLHPEIVFDLKTTIYGEKETWLRHGLTLHYDMQSYMYSLCVALHYGEENPRPFIFVTGESEQPHSIGVYAAGSTYIENGGMKYKKALAGYTACSQVDLWPDLSQDAVLEIHHWQTEREEQSWTVTPGQ